MTINYGSHSTFQATVDHISRDLMSSPTINRGEWQSIDVAASPHHATRELSNVVIQWPVPAHGPTLVGAVQPDLPWADEHFDERVSGIPYNPPPSHINWPYAKRGNGDHIKNEQFDHTYPERFWPIMANAGGICADSQRVIAVPIVGIRFQYGDLGDLVQLLRESPMTRQAYLPVWFPEDTGGHIRSGARVPCTLGYHFLMRPDWTLDINYFMRSCDIVRHFRNDVYLAARLLQWVIAELSDEQEIKPGLLTMFISSLHVMEGDVSTLVNAMGR